MRKNCHSPEAKADLEALAKALAIMKQLPCNDPRSWYYQGAMHNVPEDIAPNPYCPQFTTGSMPMSGWDGCTHGGGSKHFLIWHRLYTLHFERIVRNLSGKADFAMPYWDYTNTQPGYRVLPAIFRTPTDSLYENGRYAPLNHGEPIATRMDTALSVRTLNQNRTFVVFNDNINRAPHGAMHVYIRDPRAGKGKPQLAGILNFFGAGHHHKKGDNLDMPGMDMSGASTTQTFTFDITDEVAADSFSGGLDVQVVPKGTSAAAPITIEKITLLTQTI